MTAVLSIGSNVGDRLAHLRAAVGILEPTAVSWVYETAPVGRPDQRDFLNAVVVCELSAAAAWARAQQAERWCGRTRDVRWGPRTLDVDLIVADGPVPAGLEVPHPRAHDRAFVLAPWLDVCPHAILPGRGPMAGLLARAGTAAVRRTGLRLDTGPAGACCGPESLPRPRGAVRRAPAPSRAR